MRRPDEIPNLELAAHLLAWVAWTGTVFLFGNWIRSGGDAIDNANDLLD